MDVEGYASVPRSDGRSPIPYGGGRSPLNDVDLESPLNPQLGSKPGARELGYAREMLSVLLSEQEQQTFLEMILAEETLQGQVKEKQFGTLLAEIQSGNFRMIGLDILIPDIMSLALTPTFPATMLALHPDKVQALAIIAAAHVSPIPVGGVFRMIWCTGRSISELWHLYNAGELRVRDPLLFLVMTGLSGPTLGKVVLPWLSYPRNRGSQLPGFLSRYYLERMAQGRPGKMLRLEGLLAKLRNRSGKVGDFLRAESDRGNRSDL